MSHTAPLTLRELHHAHVAPTIVDPAGPRRRSGAHLRRWVRELVEADPDLAPAPRAEVPLTAWA